MNLTKLFILFFAVLLLGAGDIQSGKEKSQTCIACHGEDGNSVVGLWPSLAGQNPKYLLKQLQLIQSEERYIAEMNGQLDGYSDQDLQDMAAYYSNNKSLLKTFFLSQLRSRQHLIAYRCQLLLCRRLYIFHLQ